MIVSPVAGPVRTPIGVHGLPALRGVETDSPNLLVSPDDFTDPAWTSAATPTSEAATAPDGSTVDALIFDTGSYLYQDVEGTGTFTSEAYIRASAAVKLGLRIPGGAKLDIDVTTAWQRFSASGDAEGSVRWLLDSRSAGGYGGAADLLVWIWNPRVARN